MIDRKGFENLFKVVEENFPSGLADGLKDNMRASITQQLEKLDVVSGEELRIQQKVLLRTREKLEQLEQRVAELEQQLDAHNQRRD